jgi:tetraacyldisaccharide-1-P 4'-kinase
LLGFRKLGEQGTPHFLSEIEAGPYFAFCGIGNPQGFFDDLKRWNVTAAGTREFRDHHHYSQSDANELQGLAKKVGAMAFVTTEKDEQNLHGVNFAQLPVYVAVIDFVLSSESEFRPALDRILAERRSRVT